MSGRFYGCYLLASQHPRGKNRTYIGFTVKPERRIRQHNGEITAGAHKTKKWRPWDMVLVVHGFSSKIQALQFEWAWQHPERSKAVRSAAARLGKSRMQGPAGKVRLLMEMLAGDPWAYFPLTVHFTSSLHAQLRAGCCALPPHMTIDIGPLQLLAEMFAAEGDEEEDEDLLSPAQQSGDEGSDDCAGDDDAGLSELGPMLDDVITADQGEAAEGSSEEACLPDLKVRCAVCGEAGMASWLACACGARSHTACLARCFLQGHTGESLPTGGHCPSCRRYTSWQDALTRAGNVGWKSRSKRSKRPARQKRSSGGRPKKADSPSKRKRAQSKASAAAPTLPAKQKAGKRRLPKPAAGVPTQLRSNLTATEECCNATIGAAHHTPGCPSLAAAAGSSAAHLCPAQPSSQTAPGQPYEPEQPEVCVLVSPGPGVAGQERGSLRDRLAARVGARSALPGACAAAGTREGTPSIPACAAELGRSPICEVVAQRAQACQLPNLRKPGSQGVICLDSPSPPASPRFSPGTGNSLPAAPSPVAHLGVEQRRAGEAVAAASLPERCQPALNKARARLETNIVVRGLVGAPGSSHVAKQLPAEPAAPLASMGASELHLLGTPSPAPLRHRIQFRSHKAGLLGRVPAHPAKDLTRPVIVLD